MSRFATRVKIIPRAIWQRLAHPRIRPTKPERILIAHHLLLGDTIMLTPLIAKLRMLYPHAYIAMTVPHKIAPIYQSHPYGIEPLPYNPNDRASLARLFCEAGFDLAFVPGDNRYSWLALALGARWIVAFGGDRPAYKSWPVDELVAYPGEPAAWGDMVAGLWPGPSPQAYRSADWPAPECGAFPLPAKPYCVLHVGASSALKLWPTDRWRDLAESLARRGLNPVWSAGRGEEGEIARIDPQRRYSSYAGKLDLAQLWHLLKGASLLVCPDTGIAHLARLVDVSTAALFGPGSSLISGAGNFWKDSAFIPVTVADFACRDQSVLFKRELSWVRRCGRGITECRAPACMQALSLRSVEQAMAQLLGAQRPIASLSEATLKNA